MLKDCLTFYNESIFDKLLTKGRMKVSMLKAYASFVRQDTTLKSIYLVSKKSWPILYSKLQSKLDQDFF